MARISAGASTTIQSLMVLAQRHMRRRTGGKKEGLPRIGIPGLDRQSETLARRLPRRGREQVVGPVPDLFLW